MTLISDSGGVRPDSDWVTVHADQEYVLHVNLSRLNRQGPKVRRDSTGNAEYPVNSLAPGTLNYNLKLVMFKLISRIDILSVSCEIALRLMPQDLTDN